jgi:diketogulonate reductase-like aldo/keto reductase
MLIYGTAWKEERTEALVAQALAAGFRAVDTANQRKHYFEEGVGAAVRRFPRAELWLQTKFTYVDGQDHRLPYDARAPIATQVRQSVESSLQHLGTDHLDSYVLHGPWDRRGWSAEDREAWSAFEALHREGVLRALGVSNVTLEQLEALCASERVQPSWVQNRCYARTGWDREVRALCKAKGITYQGFSLLTANARELGTAEIKALAARKGATVPQLVFAFALRSGMAPLTGSSSAEHLREDLAAEKLELTAEELALIERVGLTR